MATERDDDSISRDEFSSAVAATISSVHHFYREVGRLYSGLREILQGEPEPFVAMGGFAPSSSKNQDRTIVRNWFGHLFEPNLVGEVDGDDDVDIDDEDDTDEGHTAKKRPPALLYPDRPVLIVKLTLFDPKPDVSFTPEVQYAVLGDWACGVNSNKPKGGQPFELQRHMLRRIVKAFDATIITAEGQRITTRAMTKGKAGKRSVDRRISFGVLSDPHRVEIYDLDSAESLEQLGQSIHAHWIEATSSDSNGEEFE